MMGRKAETNLFNQVKESLQMHEDKRLNLSDSTTNRLDKN